MRRVGLPPGGSTLMTSAPKPANASPQYSACSSASSMTRRPVSAPGVCVLWLWTERSTLARTWPWVILAPATGETATIGPDGLAIAPASAPEAVKTMIAAGNEIHDKPYKYGGGHGRWNDTGYDCSGSMSYVLHAAGLLDQALDSTGFMSWGDAGKGQWVTNYANSGHSYMVIAGLRFDTSGRADDGSRWDTEMRSASGYTIRHPTGL